MNFQYPRTGSASSRDAPSLTVLGIVLVSRIAIVAMFDFHPATVGRRPRSPQMHLPDRSTQLPVQQIGGNGPRRLEQPPEKVGGEQGQHPHLPIGSAATMGFIIAYGRAARQGNVDYGD